MHTGAMSDPDGYRELRYAPLLPGLALTLLFAGCQANSVRGPLSQRVAAATEVLEAPWIILNSLLDTHGERSALFFVVPGFAIVGLALGIVVPGPRTATVALLAGLTWALCSCGVIVVSI